MMKGRLHVTRQGRGPDLVLLHGWGLHGGVWETLAARLGRRARVHRVDLPGHGKSPPVPGGWSAWVAALAEVVPRGAIVGGWSLGAQLALALAAAYPERVCGLVLVSATPRFVAGDGWPLGIAAPVLERFQAELARDPGATLERFLVLVARGAARPRALLERLRAVRGASSRPAVEALAAGLQFLQDNDLRCLVARVNCPVQVIHGEPDEIVPAQAGAWLASRLPGARLALVPGGGHAPFLAEQQVCARLFERFVEWIHDEPGRFPLSHR